MGGRNLPLPLHINLSQSIGMKFLLCSLLPSLVFGGMRNWGCMCGLLNGEDRSFDRRKGSSEREVDSGVPGR